MGNPIAPIVKGVEKLGHWLHVAEEDTIGLAFKTIHAGVVTAENVKKQLPSLGADTATVATDVMDCKALGAAIALCVAGGGLNLAADAGVIAAIVTDGPALIRLFGDAGALAKLAAVDVKSDVAAVEGSKSSS